MRLPGVSRISGACRTDVIFLCLIYPVAGLVISRMAADYGMVALIFPLISGFALVGPLFGLGLYEMSRRREMGIATGWADAFAVVRAPAFGAIVVLGALLFGLFCAWLFTANLIYIVTLGPDPPVSATAFARDALTTPAGWTMIVVGCGIGFLFALVVLVIGVVSFPLLLDRNVGVGTAVTTSVRAVLINPGPMAMWGLIIAASLVIGAIPAGRPRHRAARARARDLAPLPQGGELEVVLISKPTVTVSLAQGKAKFSELLAVRIQGGVEICAGAEPAVSTCAPDALPQVIPAEASPQAWIFNRATGTQAG